MRKIIIKLFASSWYIFLTYMYDARSHLHQKRYSFFNLGARLGWVVNAMPWPLYPQERSDTHYTGGCVGLRAGLDGRGKSLPPPGFDPWTNQPVGFLWASHINSLSLLLPPENSFSCPSTSAVTNLWAPKMRGIS